MAKLNELNGKEWLPLTKSWFIQSGKLRNEKIKNHPGKYPEELVERYVKFFTKQEEIVFDPFIGVGSTAVASENLNRQCFGFEINIEFANLANDRICNKTIENVDSRLAKNYKNKRADFIITSPPYWDMLKKKRGGSNSQHNEREEKKLKLYYSDNKDDLGNIDNYNDFMKELRKVFRNSYKILRETGYMVVVSQNFRNTDGSYITFAWDIVKEMEKCGFKFEGEQIWCQENKTLGIWGFPSKFILNIHHHYCLIFRKDA